MKKTNLAVVMALFVIVAVIATLTNLCLTTNVNNWYVFLSVIVKTISVSALVCLATYFLAMAINPKATDRCLMILKDKFEKISENILSDK